MPSIDNHSFHNCPLRSSSLLVVSKDKQTIVTATDEVFDTLGYDPLHLVGKSIDLLDPRISNNKKHYILRHESMGKLPFNICIHHDPLTNAEDLDYWLIQPLLLDAVSQEIVLPRLNKLHSPTPISILRLSPFGTIEHAYPAREFPQKTSKLKGHPIMAFVHESDVKKMCSKLCRARHMTHQTFRIRWLNGLKTANEKTYEWVTLTVMNAPRRSSCSQLDDPQTRPICIIRPVDESTTASTSLLGLILSSTLSYCIQQANMNQLYDIVESLNTAIDQGRSYVVEFLIHTLSYITDAASDIMYTAPPTADINSDNYKKNTKKYYKNKTTKAKKSEKKRKEEPCFTMGTASSIKVSTGGDVIWTVPLINSTHKSYGTRWINSMKNQAILQLSATTNNIHAYWVSKKSD